MTEITHNDLKWFWERLDTQEEVDTIVNYLKNTNQTIKLEPTNDPQSGWSGANMYLDGVNLAGNGYCFRPKYMVHHAINYPKYKEAMETDEFKLYLLLKEQYKEIEQYIK